MPKIKSISLLIVIIFVINSSIILSVGGPQYEPGNTINVIWKNNGGLIWICTMITLLLIWSYQAYNSDHELELKSWIRKSIELSTIIDKKNDTILKNQTDHNSIITKIFELMNKSTVAEIKLSRKLNEMFSFFTIKYKVSHKQIGKINSKLLNHEKEIDSMKKKIAEHEYYLKNVCVPSYPKNDKENDTSISV